MDEELKYLKMSFPLVSVITVSYNSRDNLVKSLHSLLEQDYPNIESIIIDGGSSDGSKEEIQQFADKFSSFDGENGRICKWISEPDGGLYYALNKGLHMATGDIIGCFWDLYSSPCSLSDLVNAITFSEADGVHSDLIYMDENGKTVRNWQTGNGTIKQGWMPGHPTLYLKREIYDKYGEYDTTYKCSGDFEFMIRVLKNNDIRLAYLPKETIKMFYGGSSTSSIHAYMTSILESYNALKKNNYSFPAIIILKRTIRTIFQFLN